MAFLDLLTAGPLPVVAPLVINPVSALMAQQAGFRALYLGGGAAGYVKCVTEANLGLVDMVQAGIDIRTVCPLPLILDGACGWGDPMHQHRTIGMAEAAGFCAIEIEDQILPKRAHHHVGIEHVIPAELMVAKIEQSVAARRDKAFTIIARTNAARMHGIDDALRRADAYRRAGADMLFVLTRNPDELRLVHDRVGGPLMAMTGPAGLSSFGMTLAELAALGIRLVVDPSTPLLAAYRAMRDSYAAIAAALPDPACPDEAEARAIQHAIHDTIGLPAMLAIERRTVEGPQ